ncbi:response regulator [Noviherbaspirillum aridicola]|uniref:Response regulator n=2 Tax=Noviherbaspirillum aridicola TaxID=2849687 RepID=A0ABQ4Q379_9BURK|nr:response regulator [Noviherbaspirillum aridicola]
MARILVVEDTPANMKLMLLILATAGHSALQAATGRDAIAVALAEKPDLILMDVQLPDMDGLSAARELKALAATRHIPIVAVTAMAMRGDRERILAAGCDGYVEKPIDYRKLLDDIARRIQAGGADRTVP